MKAWPWVVVGAVLLGGYIYWDYAAHRQVEEYAAGSPDIPGAIIPAGAAAEIASFHGVKNDLTRSAAPDGVRVTVVWNAPEFFRAWARAEGAGDRRKQDTLYHAYAERYNLHSDLVFTIILDSASTDLRTYPIKEKAVLRNDKGIQVVPWRWLEARGASSRHLEGVLSFPQRTEAGDHMVGHLVGEHLPEEKPPSSLELVLKNLPGGQEAVFLWELPPAMQEGR